MAPNVRGAHAAGAATSARRVREKAQRRRPDDTRASSAPLLLRSPLLYASGEETRVMFRGASLRAAQKRRTRGCPSARIVALAGKGGRYAQGRLRVALRARRRFIRGIDSRQRQVAAAQLLRTPYAQWRDSNASEN